MKPDETEVAEKLNSAAELDADVVMVIAAEPDLAIFDQVKSKHHNSQPVIGLPPLAFLSNGSDGITWKADHPVMVGWEPGNPKSRDFIKRFSRETERPAHAYALLAYETGHLLAKARVSFLEKRNGHVLQRALLDAEFDGPRGMIRFDGDHQEIVSQQWQLEPHNNDNSAVSLPTANLVDIPDTLNDQVKQARTTMEKQGWLNPYLVA